MGFLHTSGRFVSMPPVLIPVQADIREVSELGSSSARQQGVEEEGLRGCLSETDTNIVRKEKHLSVIPITAEERSSPAWTRCAAIALIGHADRLSRRHVLSSGRSTGLHVSLRQ